MDKKSLHELLKEKSDIMFTFSGVSSLLELLDKLSHENEEQQETIDALQKDLKYRRNENLELTKQLAESFKENDRLRQVIKIKDDERIELVNENKELRKAITIGNNDYKKCYAENIRLAEESNNLRATIKAHETLFY